LGIPICTSRAVLLDIAEKGRLVVVEGLADVFGLGVSL
jgi:hypothetical protein